MNKQKIITWVLFFLLFFLISQAFSKPKTPPVELNAPPIGVSTTNKEYASGEVVTATLLNNTQSEVSFKSNCPKNPFRVLAWTGEKFEERASETKIDCSLSPDIKLAPAASTNVSYTYWNYSLFGTPGRYKIEVSANTGTSTTIYASPEFTIVEAGFWKKLFRTAFYQPLYNVLVFFVKIAPGRDLGFAIILLTILIRLILLVPSQRAIVSQREMQELQPKLEQIKKKYAGNQERVAQETMHLWKEHKVNPFGSCLPIVIQFPVLIALFYVIQNGLNPDNTYLLYTPLKNVDLTNIHTNFLGILELTKINKFVLPIIIGALQFFQLKLASIKKKKQDKDKEKPTGGSEMETATKTMTYIMPVMIAVFTASVPAGVGLYWGISTAFAIAQQTIANRSKKLGHCESR